MNILINTIATIMFLTIPAGVLWLCKKMPILGKIGPILILYAIGLILGNFRLIPGNSLELKDLITSVLVPLAIPMMLFNCRLKKGELKSHILALISGIAAVAITIIGGFLIFRGHLGEEAPKIGGLIAGVYTGGTPNLAALKAMLGVSDSTYLLINSYDVLVSVSYLAFILFGGISLFRKILGSNKKEFSEKDKKFIDNEIEKNNNNPYKGLFSKKGAKEIGLILIVTIIIIAAAAGLGIILPEQYFMAGFILMLTTGGIIASFVPKVRAAEHSYDIGLYLVYVFCLAIATMVDFKNLDIIGSAYILAYLLFVVFISLFVQTIMSKILKIDADTMIISSVSLINSPPFVPLIAASMKNRNVIVPGLSIGLIGYVVGNYLGFIMYELLKLI